MKPGEPHHNPHSGPVMVGLCDRRSLLRMALATSIHTHRDFDIAWSVSTPAEAPGACDILLVDFTNPTREFLDQVSSFRSQYPETIMVAMTDHTSTSCYLFSDQTPTCGLAQPSTCCLQQAFMLGARGAVSVEGTLDELFRVLRGVMDGHVMVEEPSLSLLLARLFGQRQPADPEPTLTDRERQVIASLARGRSNKEIGTELGIQEQTVKNHVSHILGKLGLEDRLQIVVFAARRGLVSLDEL